MTEKHKVNESKEKERISKLGATIVFGRLFGDLTVTRALGDREYKKPTQVPNGSCVLFHPLTDTLHPTNRNMIL